MSLKIDATPMRGSRVRADSRSSETETDLKILTVFPRARFPVRRINLLLVSGRAGAPRLLPVSSAILCETLSGAEIH
jgi:hypothetical protein